MAGLESCSPNKVGSRAGDPRNKSPGCGQPGDLARLLLGSYAIDGVAACGKVPCRVRSCAIGLPPISGTRELLVR